jgi:glycosyltransferase involved in cell wall biosynthesis
VDEGDRPLRPAVWITWERQLRNRSMASRLGIPLFEIERRGSRLLGYARGLAATWRVLATRRPGVVFAANPSLVLAYFLLLLRPIFRYRLVMDAHFAGVLAFDGSRVRQAVLDAGNRLADRVIVTNREHAELVRRLGGVPFVCPDPLPRLELPSVPGEDKLVFFICSFDVDEPYAAVFEAARILAPRGYRLVASGRYTRVGLRPESLPHVELLGFVPEADFYSRLAACAVVVDLTTCEGCLVCGAYEAMVAGKPLVLSDTRALREYFTHGTVFTRHEPERIADAILEAHARRDELGAAIRAWIPIAETGTDENIEDLRSFCRRSGAFTGAVRART